MDGLTFITGNAHKVEEVRALLGEVTLAHAELDIPEVQGSSADIAAIKAAGGAEELGKPCFAEDVSLACEALGGMPGPYIKHFVSTVGAQGIWTMLQGFSDKRAQAVCVIGYCAPGEEPIVFEGIVEGEIVAPRGKGWGFDAVFQPKGSTKTYGEMTPEEKNAISHRALAVREFRAWLEGLQ